MREAFARAARDTRIRLDVTQQQLSDATGISRGYLAKIERARANPPLAMLDRIADALGLQIELTATAPIFLSDRRSHDLVHAWRAETVGRRLTTAGWQVGREIAVSDGRVHAWIDMLGFNPRSRVLLIIEIKTQIEDVGALQRQVGWYERHAVAAARRLGWSPGRVSTWLLGLATDEIERSIVANRTTMEGVFPGRAAHMLEVLAGQAPPAPRAIALVDPASHRPDWLIRTRLEGRRSTLRFGGYADAARRLTRR